MRLLLTASLLLLIVCLAACGGLSGEPEIVATLPPPTEVIAETGYPLQAPDLANGAAIFTARCATCHGITGAGDGELVSTGQVMAPASFIDPTTSRDQTPKAWFDTITQGRIESLMPPWQDALSEEQRWDVALYSYTLPYNQDQIERGESLWLTHCGESCDSLAGVGSLDDQQVMAAISDAELRAALPDSIANDADAWAVVAFLRSQSLQNLAVFDRQAGPGNTEESLANAGPVEGAVSGQINNGTAGGSVPEGLDVLLFQWDSALTPLETRTTTSESDGTYRFDDVTLDASHAYAVVAEYRDRRFISEFVTDQAVANLEMPVTIYELTEDPAVITISGVVNQITALADSIQVVQSLNIRNESDRLYTTDNPVADGQFASLIFSLPPGSTFLGAPNANQRFVVTEDQTTVVDTVPVLPGEGHIVQFVYLVPYEGGAIIDQALNYRLDGEVRLLLQPTSLQAISDALPSIGPQVVGDVTYAGYGGPLLLGADDSLRFELRGESAPAAAELQGPEPVTANNLVTIVLLILIAQGVLVAGLYWFYRRRNRNPATVESTRIDTLVQQIAELDSAHEQGQINHDYYHHQRRQLKAELAELMREAHE